jgi:hypothetical protein
MCPYCAKKAGKASLVCWKYWSALCAALRITSQPPLRVPQSLPEVDLIWLRWDAPTLIVAITWHETTAKFGRFLYDRLSFSYATNEEAVSLSLLVIISA